MILSNINLLSDEQLARIGLSEADIAILRQNSPVESTLNLFGLGIDIEKVRRLLSFGIVGSTFDLPYLPFVSIEPYYTFEDPHRSVENLDLPGVSSLKGGVEVEYYAGRVGFPFFAGFLFPGVVTPLEGSTIGPINDCTTTKKFRVDGKGRGTSPGPVTDFPLQMQQQKALAEDMAIRRAKSDFYNALDGLLQTCQCLAPACPVPKVTTRGPIATVVNPDDPPGPGGGPYRRSAVATGMVEITCLALA